MALLVVFPNPPSAGGSVSDSFLVVSLSSHMQAVSLDLYAGRLQSQGAGHAIHDGAAPALVLPRLLCALGHPQSVVRAAALRCCQALASACKQVWGEECDTLLPAGTCAALLKALCQQGTAIEGDPAASERLLDSTLDGAGAGGIRPGLGLSSKQAGQLGTYLLAVLVPQEGRMPLEPAALYTLSFLARRAAVSSTDPAAVLGAVHQVLRQFALGPAGSVGALPSEGAAMAAAGLVGLCTPDRLLTVLGQDAGSAAGPGTTATAVLEVLLAFLQSAGVEGASPARLVAVRQFTGPLMEELNDTWKERLLQVCVLPPPIHESSLCCVLHPALLCSTRQAPIVSLGACLLPAGSAGSLCPGP